MKTFDLSEKKALVCGASQGIGAAIAQVFAAAGAQIIALARSEDRLRALINDLPATPHGPHSYIVCDVGDRERLKEQLTTLIGKHFAIQILVCNTGGPASGPLINASEPEFISAFENHVLVNALLASMLVPGMQKSGYGRIINIISTSAKAPIVNLGVSNTIRAAVASWSKTLATELATTGITVNNVLPGYTQTSRLEGLIAATAQRLGKPTAQVRQSFSERVPMKRFGSPEEVAYAALFLASPKASYITGIHLPVDGGRTESL